MIKTTNTETAAVEVCKLCKSYSNKVLALNDITFNVKNGEIVGLLGPNGAGKTTVLNIITGCLSFDAGTVKLNGCDLTKDSSNAKKRLGYLPEQPPLYLNMTISEYLNYVCGLKKIKKKQQEISRVCALCKIGANLNVVIKNLSKGYRQRIGIAQALLGNPSIIVLDEPTSGLDPGQIVEIRSLIKTLSKTQTVILSTQILSEIHNLCDRIIILCGGEIIACGAETEIIKKSSLKTTYNLAVVADETQIENALAELKDIIKLEFVRSHSKITNFRITPLTNNNIRLKVSKLLADNKIYILKFTDNKASLENVFLELTVQKAEQDLKKKNESALSNKNIKKSRSVRKQFVKAKHIIHFKNRKQEKNNKENKK